MGTAACDAGHADDQAVAGPPVHLVAANVGMTDAGQIYPADGVIRLTFDRNLLPSTVTRQSLVVQDSMMNTYTSIVDYDPVARVISLSNPNGGDGGTCWLAGGVYYEIVLPVASSGNLGGLEAIDTATLEAPLTIGFETPANPCPGGTPAVTPATNFCVDVFPIFLSKCTGSYCHSSPQPIPMGATMAQFPGQTVTAPAAGLVLDDPVTFAATAIGKPANGANTGPNPVFAPPSAIFGINMPIVDPGGDPANSWLMYKLLLAIPSTAPDPSVDVTCGGVSTIRPFYVGPEAGPMSASERAILSNFVSGREMPYPAFPGAGDPAADAANGGNPELTFDELERVRAWLTNPVVPSSCPTACSMEAAAADAGPSDAGSMDAGVDATTRDAKSD